MFGFKKGGVYNKKKKETIDIYTSIPDKPFIEVGKTQPPKKAINANDIDYIREQIQNAEDKINDILKDICCKYNIELNSHYETNIEQKKFYSITLKGII